MRSLLSVLDEAIRRSASEVLLESGQPIVYVTARGSEAERDVLPRTDLFDMIVAAVDASEQVELAVGNPVGFEVEAGASWRVSAEPGADGIMVSATRAMPAVRGGLSIELDDDDLELEGDFGVVDSPNPSVESSESSRPPTSPAHESTTWELEDEDELDLEFDVLPDPPRFAESSGSEPSLVGGVDDIGVPDDDEDSDFDPFSSAIPILPTPPRNRRTPSGTIQASIGGLVPPPKPDAATRRDIPLMAANPMTATRREISAAMAPNPALASSPSASSELAEGSLVYVLDTEGAEALARQLGHEPVILDEQADLCTAAARLQSGGPGVAIIRREDPSEVLGWVLRRLEEGHRVLVETSSRSAEGARRGLLGVHANEQALRWLDLHEAFVLELGAGTRIGPFTRP